MGINVRQATKRDIDLYVYTLGRREDIEEIMLGFNSEHDLCVFLYAGLGDTKVIYDEETKEIVGIGGYSPIPSSCTDSLTIWDLWLCCTPYVEKHSIRFLRWVKKCVSSVRKDNKIDFFNNAAYKKNELHIKFLEWLGCAWVNENAFYKEFIL